MRIDVDATEVRRRLVRAHVEIPVTAGPVTISYPLWSPADHAPFQHVGQIGSLVFRAEGKVVAWRRDLVDAGAFHLVVPRGATRLEADFEFLLPAPGEALADSSQRVFILRWNLYTLYVAGRPVSGIPVEATATLPKGWRSSTALPVESTDGRAADGETVHYKRASLETVVDSPVLSGQYLRTIDLTPGSPVLHEMDVVAETEAELPSEGEIRAKYGRLMVQAQRLFGAEPYRGYKFLITASDYATPGGGFEHSESSDTRVPEIFFHDESRKGRMEDLLAHEYAHSWNGKYRRPADGYPVDYQQPEKTDLLWVYESLTDYLGVVLASRSGFTADADAREYWATIAAKVDHETGRTWRNMQDTADSVPLTMDELFFAPPGWDSWLRMMDYYDEGALLWLEANEIIVQQTGGKRSLDDFLRAFFGGQNGSPRVKTYTAEEVWATLNGVAPYDWKGFFAERLNSHAPHAPMGGLERSGWRLVYTAQPNSFLSAARKSGLGATMNSIGLAIGGDGTVTDVLRGGAGERAGLVPGMKVLQVNGQAFSAAGLLAAIAGTSQAAMPIRLRTEMAGVTEEKAVTYEGGLRNPHLERIEGEPDRLTTLFAPLPATK